MTPSDTHFRADQSSGIEWRPKDSRPFIPTNERLGSAIRLLEQTQPDLILLDLYLKEGSGVDVLRHIRESGTKVRTVVMTSEPSGELQSACLSLGAHRFLDKAELLNALNEETEGLARELAR